MIISILCIDSECYCTKNFIKPLLIIQIIVLFQLFTPTFVKYTHEHYPYIHVIVTIITIIYLSVLFLYYAFVLLS